MIKKIMWVMILLYSCNLFSQETLLDKVVVIVNDSIILQSEIDFLISSIHYKSKREGFDLPEDSILYQQIIDKLVIEKLQIELANKIGLEINDFQLQQTIDNLLRDQGITLNDLIVNLKKDGLTFEQYQEQIRKEIILSQIQRMQLQNRIHISEQEVQKMVLHYEQEDLEHSLFHLGHILIPFEQDEVKARDKILMVAEQLKKGVPFDALAKKYSAGDKALLGGDWGYMKINDMPSLFAEIVVHSEKGAILGPIKSGAGYHLIKVFDIEGKVDDYVQEIHARHILIKKSVIVDDKKAFEMLSDYRQQILNNTMTFEEAAKKYSIDLKTSTKGGDLGWEETSIYEKPFKNVLDRLELNEISKPFETSFGWHIVQLLDKRRVNVKAKINKNKAYQILYQRQFIEQLSLWQQELKNNAYIKIFDKEK